ncbi:MAG: zinc ribbon domain-containing protein [Haliscomenobacter sp.]|uniref:zinc ribbon domain-containing protein n=1 Tax=Haliscomenobacter sp. TaxID=2717303 RepID=UPI0029AFE5CF|nr:zinc ribbon domain-containing protein [Haliscomenobacter sp.]MDX2069014.1 zinc ribbon domain-containing protein [Haliscomenobacter sp.]
MICPNCETEALGNYCGNCGHQMFLGLCSHCQNKVFGNFCANCGTLFNEDQKSIQNTRVLIQVPKVRAFINQCLFDSGRGQSAKKFFDLMDLSFAMIKDFELKDLKEILQLHHQELTMVAERAPEKTLDLPFEEVILKLIGTLASCGYPLDLAQGANDGLAVISVVPFELSTWGGHLLIGIEIIKRKKTRVIVNARIKGKAYEAGQSKALAQKVLSNIESTDLGNLLEELKQ